MQSSKLFRSAQGESEFLAAYDAAIRLWPVPLQRRNLHTRFGRTHVITCGDESAPPLVLLHCALMTSAVWGPAIGELAARFRVHAVDVIGDMGRTVPADPPGTHAQFAGWLAEVCDGLGIERALLVGWSFGGFVAANFALHYPARVERHGLLAPFAVFTRPGAGFLAGFLPLLIRKRGMSRWFERKLSASGGFGPAEYSELLWQRFKNGRVQFRTGPRVFFDSELRELTMPVLLLVGEKEFLYDARAAVDRARRLLPKGEAHLLRDCNHAMIPDQADLVMELLVEFLIPGR